MSETTATRRINMPLLVGSLIITAGMMFANFGTAVPVAGEVAKMNAMTYYVLVSALGSMGSLLVLPITGKLMQIYGQRIIILLGMVIQIVARIGMMFCTSWVPYGACYFLQSVGGGLYQTTAYILIAIAVDAKFRAKYFGYIAVANAIGAVLGPIVVSTLYANPGSVSMLAYISHLPLILIGFILIFKSCPHKKNPEAAKGFDFLGVLLMIVGIACIVFFLNLGGKMFAWLSVPSIILLVVGAVYLQSSLQY